ncbi:hypothetical protein CW704_00905 [Candidatus Bathyarchaeota archaeon]|nr:MAG: hypothetical protein CW704_00905 [Candidatus Bathyarchaeota archaeon]
MVEAISLRHEASDGKGGPHHLILALILRKELLNFSLRLDLRKNSKIECGCINVINDSFPKRI